MGVTRLKRKGRKNRAKSATRRFSLKHLTATPVIKNVDIEELKKQFLAPKKEAPKAVETKAEAPAAPKAEAPAEVAAEAPAKEAPKAKAVAPAEEKPAAKKPAAKKAAPKKDAAEKAPKAKAAKKDKDAE